MCGRRAEKVCKGELNVRGNDENAPEFDAWFDGGDVSVRKGVRGRTWGDGTLQRR